MSGVFWQDGEHINIADLFAINRPIPTARCADWNILVDNETEAVRIKIGLVNNVVVGILNGSAHVYKCCVHDECPVRFVAFLVGSDVIAIWTLKPRQVLQIVPDHSELIFYHTLNVILSTTVPWRVFL